MSLGMIRQIVVISDGQANVGCSPVEAARAALARGVAVSAVGILDGGHLGERGRREVEAIAANGGGKADFAVIPDLSRTLHAITWQVTQCTLNVIINQELKKISGLSLLEMPPEKRAGVINLMSGLADDMDLKMALLLDTSASMTGKMPAVLESIRDLISSLQERKGRTDIMVTRYPGQKNVLEVLSTRSDRDFHWDELRPAGRTPTGPAILEALKYLAEKRALLEDNQRPALDVVI